MITDPGETHDAVVDFVVNNPDRVFTAHELAGLLVALEKNVKAALHELVSEGLLIQKGESYRRTINPDHAALEAHFLALVKEPLKPEEEELLPAAHLVVGAYSYEEVAHAFLVARREKGGGP